MAINMRFITGIRWHKGLLEMLNNMTFVYDPSWSMNNSTKATFPVCFFHVKSNGCHEIMNSEISQKQMLFFNSSLGEASSDPAVDSGLLNVVADNIVTKPKMYKLDVVIPYHNLTLLDQSFVYNTQTAQAIHTALIRHNNKVGKATAKADKIIGSYQTLSQPYFNLIKTLIKTLMSANYANGRSGAIDEWISNVSHQPEYNKESLETMWRTRHIVKMKMWNSWQYKYVAIVDIDITKEGEEDGVYEATLTVQEMPIVTMYAQGKKMLSVFERVNPLLEERGKRAISTLDYASGILGQGH